MRPVEVILAVGWAGFWSYWLIAAFSMKRGRPAWGRELVIRVVMAGVVLLLYEVGAFRGYRLNTSVLLAVIGLTLFGLGLAYAIRARIHIGRNWGTPMTRKTEPELVTSGPYRLVRHPIYSGFLAAIAGTAIALSWQWLIAFGLAAIYFVYSARVEEAFLIEQFPDAYPPYKRSTKMLIPWVV